MATESNLSAKLARQATNRETRTVLDEISAIEPEIARSLQSEAGAATLVRHYYSAVRFNPLLMECTSSSLVAALLLSAQCRLEPGPLGHVYLVPFRNTNAGTVEVVWMLGYTGIVELARRGGAEGCRSTVVWDCDETVAPWEDEKGLHWRLKPGPLADRGDRVGVLVSWREGRERQALLCPPSRVDVAIRTSKNPYARELREEDWYWRKTGIRYARPWLPLATDSGQTFAIADRSDGGVVTGYTSSLDMGVEATLEQGEVDPQ